MALGDGSSWDESAPTNDTVGTSIDDHIQDLRKGTRSRMALEHEWPASQSAASEGGKHKFITIQEQSTKPTLSGTQVAAIYCKTVGTTGQGLYFEDAAASEIRLNYGTAVGLVKTTYDSGWFAVTKGNSYTKTHGLGTTNATFQLWAATDTTGASPIIAVLIEGGSSNVEGGQITDVSISTCKVIAATVKAYYSLTTTGYVREDTGFYRVYAIAYV